MAVVTPPDYSDGSSAAGASRPAATARLSAIMAGTGVLGKIWWTCLSIGLFVGIWELCWLVGWADPKLLPPPPTFIGSIGEQGKFFHTPPRRQIGPPINEGPSRFERVRFTITA